MIQASGIIVVESVPVVPKSTREAAKAERDEAIADRVIAERARDEWKAQAEAECRIREGAEDRRDEERRAAEAELERLREALKRIAGMGGDLAFAGDVAQRAMSEREITERLSRLFAEGGGSLYKAQLNAAVFVLGYDLVWRDLRDAVKSGAVIEVAADRWMLAGESSDGR